MLSSIVAVGPENAGEPCGAGFLITDMHVLTCAHVINACMGPDLQEQKRPVSPVTVRFAVDASSTPILANVESDEHWLPPRLVDDDRPVADAAILTLQKPCRGAVRAHMRERDLAKGMHVSVLGYPKDWGKGQGQECIIGGLATGRYELLRADDERPFVRQGFSGSPVMYESPAKKVVGVVGMVVTARTELRDETAYMMPIQDLRHFTSRVAGTDRRNGVVDDFPHIALVEEHVSREVYDKRTAPQFELRLEKADSADVIAQLFREDPKTDYDDSAALPERVLDDPELSRLLIQSPGGAGKSNFLAGLVQLAVERGMVPFLLDAASPKSTATSDPSGWNLEYLLSTFTVGGGITQFREAGSAQQIVLFADRLNENPLQATAILQALVRVLQNEVPEIRLVIADRLRDRLQNIQPLHRATILPLTVNEIHKHLGYSPDQTSAKLLAMPFFLEMELRVGKQSKAEPRLMRSEMFSRFFAIHVFDKYFSKHPDSTGQERAAAWAALAAAAFRAYEQCKKTVIPSKEWAMFLGEAQKLQTDIVEGAMLENVKDGTVEFRHQLLHDFLAGTHLTNKGKDFWHAQNFDVATLTAQSYDAIEFAAEILGPSNATNFAVQAYNWSWFGVLESVRNLDAGRHGGNSPVSVEFRDALYFLNAMRLFDCFEASRERTRSILADVRTPSGRELKSIQDVWELREVVRNEYKPTEAYFENWKSLFLRTDTPPVSVQDLIVLWSDPFKSWTATSVFRYMKIDRSVLDSILMAYDLARTLAEKPDDAMAARWRFVHVLGVAKDHTISKFLWSVITDRTEHYWVRFGAARSYIENATFADPDDRRDLLKEVVCWIDQRPDIPKPVMAELRATAQLADDAANPGWHADYLEILEAGIRYSQWSKDTSEQRAWEQRRDQIAALVQKTNR